MGSFWRGKKRYVYKSNLKEIGAKYKKSVAQVILRWLMQRNIVALAKSTHIERMRENFEIFDFQLSEHDMKIISELDTNTSLFFNHQTPEAVDMFVNMITERKGKI